MTMTRFAFSALLIVAALALLAAPVHSVTLQPGLPRNLVDGGVSGAAPAAPVIAGGTIAGQVLVSGTATPIAGVTVEAYLGGVLQGSATTSADGTYAIAGLAAGSYDVQARKQYYATQTQTGILVVADQTTQADFGLEPIGVIMGQVKERGTTTSLADATVTAYLNSQPVASATTDSDGYYVIETGTAGSEYVVAAAKAGYETQIKYHVAVTLGQTTYINFWLQPPPRLTGQVRDRATGLPLIGAQVEVYSGLNLVASIGSLAPYGVYRLGTSLPVGTYAVEALMAGYVPRWRSYVTVSDTATTYCNFDLDPRGTSVLSGWVNDKFTGAILPGTRVDVYTSDTHAWVAYAVAKIWGGGYEIDGLDAGTYTVTASLDGYLSSTKRDVTVTAGTTTFCNFFLEPQTVLKGQVSDAVPGVPLEGATVDLFKDGAVWASTTSGPPFGIYEMPMYLYQGIPGGESVVRASKPGYVHQEKWGVTIALGSTTYVNFVLQPSGKLKGQVTDTDTGLPLVGAVVRAYRNGVRCAEAITTQPYGLYEIDSDLPAGTFVVTAGKPGYSVFGRTGIAVTAGATTFVNFPLQSE